MSLMQLRGVGLSYAGRVIFQDVSLRLEERSRLGVVGRNGAGKSTLLRVLMGEETPEQGEVLRSRGLTVGWLAQMETSGNVSVLERALEAFADLRELEEELRALEARLADGDETALERYGLLQERWERRGAYVAEAQAKKVLTGLGFATAAFDRPVAALSGGERTRLGLARLLLEAPDLLLLDEPTNHLDMNGAEFLEGWVQAYKGAVVVASHDRAFLDATVDHIAEVAGGRVAFYTGNYSAYVEQREAARARQAALHERQQAFIAKTEEFIRRNIAGQATKQAQARRKMLERLERVEAVQEERRAAIRLEVRSPSDLEVLAAEELRVAYGERELIAPANFVIQRGERIGIVGPNGAGKSSLLKVLLGKQRAAGGWVRLGGKVRVGYHDQELSAVDPSRTVLEELAKAAPALPPERLRAHAGRFLFSGEEAERPIATMSGGERARACLAKLTLAGFNLLVLDEPTNHLDTASREALEEALDGYAGTLLCVSHDRWFLERCCERIFWLEPQAEGGARLEDHRGTFSEARARREALRSTASNSPLPRAGEGAGERVPFPSGIRGHAHASVLSEGRVHLHTKQSGSPLPLAGKGSGERVPSPHDAREAPPEDPRAAFERRRAEANARKAAERRIQAIDRELAPLEEKLSEVEARLADPALSTDYLALGELQAEKDALEEHILSLLEERESLQAAS